MLDEKLIFSNSKTGKKDYASKMLNYPLEQGEANSYDKLMSVLYSPAERHKIEWAIGSVVSGDSKRLQKFMVLYGAAGTGKSTVLNIIQQLFDGYYSVFDAKALGSSSKAFLKIAKVNKWILLSATPGDTWQDYIPVFIANGFYRNKTDFIDQHVVYDWRSKYPKVDRYLNTGRLIRLRNRILVTMEFERHTTSHHQDVPVSYNIPLYKDISRNRWNPWEDRPIETASELCMNWRRVVNSDESRSVAVLEIMEDHPKVIIFYNFDYELDILKNLGYPDGTEVAEWNGHKHQEIPTGDKWVYLVQYTAGCEGWNCITTDTIIFYSQNYSYKVMVQASGRIDRLTTPFSDLYYFHLKSFSGIDLAISKALKEKKNFNEGRFVGWSTAPMPKAA